MRQRTCAYPDCTYYSARAKKFCCMACACDFKDWMKHELFETKKALKDEAKSARQYTRLLSQSKERTHRLVLRLMQLKKIDGEHK